MPDAHTLTVLIPHLNDQDGLARTLATLERERQDVPGLEVIIIDNGSPNPPEALTQKYNARLLHEAEPGPGPARSTGTRAANAPILAFIDSDCTAEPGWAKGILEHFERPGAEPIMGGEINIELRDPTAPDMVEAYECIYSYRQKLYIFKQNYSSTANLAMRAEVFKDVGDFAGIAIAEDRDWGERASAMGYAIAYHPHIKVSTPARPDFAAVRKKTDRQIGHDYAILGKDLTSRLRWGFKAVALIGSPVGEIVRIAASDRVSGLRAKSLALLGVTKARAYRGWLMLSLLFKPDDGSMSGRWNRS